MAARRRQKIHPDQELIGLGAANVAAALGGPLVEVGEAGPQSFELGVDDSGRHGAEGDHGGRDAGGGETRGRWLRERIEGGAFGAVGHVDE